MRSRRFFLFYFTGNDLLRLKERAATLRPD
nr:MAG TPA: hypothetical protein [Microviridae sp.]